MDIINIYNAYIDLKQKTGEDYILFCNPIDFERELHIFKDVEIKQDKRCAAGTTYIMRKKDVLDEI